MSHIDTVTRSLSNNSRPTKLRMLSLIISGPEQPFNSERINQHHLMLESPRLVYGDSSRADRRYSSPKWEHLAATSTVCLLGASLTAHQHSKINWNLIFTVKQLVSTCFTGIGSCITAISSCLVKEDYFPPWNWHGFSCYSRRFIAAILNFNVRKPIFKSLPLASPIAFTSKLYWQCSD